MSNKIDFESLNVVIPTIIYSYTIEQQKEVYDYLVSLDEHHKNAYTIAVNHLGSSFNIYKSIGFKEWKSKQQT